MADSAKDRALRLLAVRSRSREELRRRLLRAGYREDEIDPAIEELERAGLVDDVRFSREVVRDRAERRLAGNRAVRAALWEKGFPREVAEAALADAGDETERARTLARSRATRLGSVAPEAAYRRLYGLLLRRGFPPKLASEASREALGKRLEEASEAFGEALE